MARSDNSLAPRDASLPDHKKRRAGIWSPMVDEVAVCWSRNQWSESEDESGCRMLMMREASLSVECAKGAFS